MRIIESSDCRSICEDVLRAPCPLNTAPWRKFFYSNLCLFSSCTAAPGSWQGRVRAGWAPPRFGSRGKYFSAAWWPGLSCTAGHTQELLCWQLWTEAASSRSVFSHQRQPWAVEHAAPWAKAPRSLTLSSLSGGSRCAGRAGVSSGGCCTLGSWWWQPEPGGAVPCVLSPACCPMRAVPVATGVALLEGRAAGSHLAGVGAAAPVVLLRPVFLPVTPPPVPWLLWCSVSLHRAPGTCTGVASSLPLQVTTLTAASKRVLRGWCSAVTAAASRSSAPGTGMRSPLTPSL